MAQEKPNQIREWFAALSKQWPVIHRHASEWIARVRQEPELIRESGALRYAAYIVGGVILLGGAKCASGWLVAPPSADTRPYATTADFHVVCSNPDCGRHFVVVRRFGFSRFPVECPHCKQQTGQQAQRCFSPLCQGKWVIPQLTDSGERRCSICGERLP